MIGYEKNFDEKRIMEKIKAPNIRQICPNEELYFANRHTKQQSAVYSQTTATCCPKAEYCSDDTLYILYKSNDLTYPDVGKVITKFYNRPVVEHIWGKEVLNNIEKFLKINCREKDKAIKLIEELCNMPNVDTIKIEDIFNIHKNILKPTCQLYKMCYYLPTEMHMLDIRYYNGEPTRINRSCMMYGIIGFAKGKLTKEQALNIWRVILDGIDPTDTIENIECTLVPEHTRNLKADRYHKKGEIKVDSYAKLNVRKRPYGN